MSYTFTPSSSAPQETALRTATAVIIDGRNYEIHTTWDTIFRHKLVIHSAFPGAPIDAYVEYPANNGHDKAKTAPLSISMIYVKPTDGVPHGAKLMRVWGSEKLWMLYFPPKPLVTGGKKQGVKKTEAPSRRDLLDMQALLKENADLAVDPEVFKKWGTLDDAFFEGYAKDVGYGITGDDVRVHFANDIADPKYRRLHRQHNDAFWQQFWRLVTRDGTLRGTASSHWTKGHDKEKNPVDKLEDARLRRAKELSGFGSYDELTSFMSQSMAHGFGPISGDEFRREGARRICDEKYRRRFPQRTERDWEELWEMTTGGGTLAGVPKHWKYAG